MKKNFTKLFLAKVIGLIGLLMIDHLLSFAQVSPGIQWQKSYGGSDTDFITVVRQTNDGGYIIGAGTSSSGGQVTYNHGNYDVWVVKTDASGTIQWQKSYGGSGNDYLTQLIPDANGGYIFSGNTYSNDGDVSGNHGGCDAWVVKINDTGAVVWKKTMGSTATDFFNNMIQTPDSGYMAVGGCGANNGDVAGCGYHGGYYDMFIVKFTKTGVVSWKKCYGGSGGDWAFDVKNTFDGGLIISGGTYSNDGIIHGLHGTNTDAWVLKIDSIGDVQWNKVYGGTCCYDAAFSILQKPNGNYIFLGYAGSNDGDIIGNHGGSDYWVVDLDDTGKILWSKCYGGWSNDDVTMMSATNDSCYILSGNSSSVNDDVVGHHGTTLNEDYWIVKINDTGRIQWSNCFGGSGNEYAGSVIQTADSGYAIGGQTFSNDGDVTTNYGGSDGWFIKLHKDPPAIVSPIHASDAINVYPTLTNGIVHIEMPQGYENATIQLTDITGKQINTGINTFGCSRVLHLNKLADGMYLLNIINNKEVNTYKVIYHP